MQDTASAQHTFITNVLILAEHLRKKPLLGYLCSFLTFRGSNLNINLPNCTTA